MKVNLLFDKTPKNFSQKKFLSKENIKNDIKPNNNINLNLSSLAHINKSLINFGSITRYNEYRVNEIKNHLKEAIENKNYERILEYLGMQVRSQDDNGMLHVDALREPDDVFKITYKDIGVDINDLLSKIKVVDRHVYLPDERDIKSTGAIEKIGDFAVFGENSNLTEALASKYLEMIKTDLAEPIKNKDYKQILEYLGMKVECEKNTGLLAVSNLKEPNAKLGITYKTIGVDINDLLDNIIFVENDLCLSGDKEVKSTGAIEFIGGNADFYGCSNLTEISNLKRVRQDIELRRTPLKSTGSLEYVDSYAYLPEELNEFPNIKCIDFVCNATEEQEKIIRERKLTDWYQTTDAERAERAIIRW